MPYTLEGSRWVVGKDVDFFRNQLKEVDQRYCMKILEHLLSGELQGVGRRAQQTCNNAVACLRDGGPGHQPITVADLPLMQTTLSACTAATAVDVAEAQPLRDLLLKCRSSIARLADIQIFTSDRLTNPLALGDFSRALFDLIEQLERVPQLVAEARELFAADQLTALNAVATVGLALQPYVAFCHSLRNPQAFDKTTNRVRVSRRHVLDQLPAFGGAVWHLPGDDVLGTIDRLLGYYETADISGSTTDALGVIAMLAGGRAAGDSFTLTPRNELPGIVNRALDSGAAFAAFAGMVAQMHHSIPESMMALNLIPTDSGVRISKYYSPWLVNSGMSSVRDLLRAWRAARNAALGYPRTGRARHTVALIVVQDVYQMPNRPSEDDEIALLLKLGYSSRGNLQTSSGQFGPSFYNTIVRELNRRGPGPAITLESIASAVLATLCTPADPGGADDAVRTAATRGMGVSPSTYTDSDTTLASIAAPFVADATYSRVRTVTEAVSA